MELESKQELLQLLQLRTASLSLRFFQRGFVKKMEIAMKDAVICYQAQCEQGNENRVQSPQTRTGNYHRTKAVDEGAMGEGVPLAECMPCPVGNATRASCKHSPALLFALEEFIRLRYTKERLVCMDVLQVLNRPHRRKVYPVKFPLSTLKG